MDLKDIANTVDEHIENLAAIKGKVFADDTMLILSSMTISWKIRMFMESTDSATGIELADIVNSVLMHTTSRACACPEKDRCFDEAVRIFTQVVAKPFTR